MAARNYARVGMSQKKPENERGVVGWRCLIIAEVRWPFAYVEEFRVLFLDKRN